MTLQAKPFLPNFGAEMFGLDLSKPIDDSAKAAIFEAQNRWGITVWRNTGLNDELHIEMSRIFGYPEVRGSTGPKRFRLPQPELVDVGNLDVDGNIVTDPLILQQKHGDRLWHTDGSFIDTRSAYSLLLAYEVPAEGGETYFADMRGAYDDLPQDLKDRLEKLEGLHSYWSSRQKAGFPISDEDVDAKPVARHPLVHTHAGSGRKSLYIASHIHDIKGDGLTRAEGRQLLADLLAHATQPQYVFGVKWGVGDMVIWDNLCSMHRGCEFDEAKYRRDMRRTTIREGAAPEFPDDPYAAKFSPDDFKFMNTQSA